MTKQESEVLEKFGSEEVKSAKLFRVWHKVEKAEKDFLDKALKYKFYTLLKSLFRLFMLL